MIEVEKDYQPDDGAEERLSKTAEFLGVKELHDVYFDTPEYSLGKKDHWLRLRNGRYELKMVVRGTSQNAYREIEEDEGIKEELGFSLAIPLEDSLRAASFVPFCDCKTIRRQYRLGDIKIDLDEATYPDTDFTYKAAEIEIMVEQPDEVPQAERRMDEFAALHGFAPRQTYGKIIEYVKRVRPDQFKILVEAGSIY